MEYKTARQAKYETNSINKIWNLHAAKRKIHPKLFLHLLGVNHVETRLD